MFCLDKFNLLPYLAVTVAYKPFIFVSIEQSEPILPFSAQKNKTISIWEQSCPRPCLKTR